MIELILALVMGGVWGVGLMLMGLGWLALLRVQVEDGLTRFGLGFWLGFVHVGWVTMWVGYLGLLTPGWLLVVSVPWVVLGGLVAVRQRWRVEKNVVLALVGLGVVGLVSLAGVMVPPTEGDSLAYHFALPKLYVESGGLVFAPVAVTFAGPQLTQMVSTFAYALGGERLMLVASWVGTCMMGVMVLAMLRRFVALPLAAVGALLVLGMPCVTYAFTAGTTELKQAGMMVALGVVWAFYIQQRNLGLAVVLAILVGAQVASKMFMVFLLPVVVVAWMVQVWVQRWPWQEVVRHGAVLALVGFLVGAPWYVSNWVMYGSPLFPALAVELGSPWWSAMMQEVMQRVYLDNELMVGRDVGMLVAYPWVATFFGAVVDSDRVGLGPFLPLLMMGGVGSVGWLGWAVWWRRVSDMMLLCGVLGVVAVGYYGLWFYLGVSGRSRHLLPIVPLLLVPTMVALGWVWACLRLVGRGVLVVMVVGVMVVQLGMAGLLNKAAWEVALGRVSEQEFLRGQAAHYAAAELVNDVPEEVLSGRVLVVELRNILYFLQRPYFQNQLEYSAVVPLGVEGALGDAGAVWRALRVGGFGAWVSEEVTATSENMVNGHGVLRALMVQGCAVQVGRHEGVQRASRAMAGLGEVKRVYGVYKLVPEQCGLEQGEDESEVVRLYRGVVPMLQPRLKDKGF